MSFQNLDITRILEQLKNNPYTIDVPVQSTITITTCSPSRPDENKAQGLNGPKRCPHQGCKKKLFLTDYACKCEKTYCAAHRPPELHACAFDFKKASDAELMKKYGKAIVAKKLDTI